MKNKKLMSFFFLILLVIPALVSKSSKYKLKKTKAEIIINKKNLLNNNECYTIEKDKSKQIIVVKASSYDPSINNLCIKRAEATEIDVTNLKKEIQNLELTDVSNLTKLELPYNGLFSRLFDNEINLISIINAKNFESLFLKYCTKLNYLILNNLNKLKEITLPEKESINTFEITNADNLLKLDFKTNKKISNLKLIKIGATDLSFLPQEINVLHLEKLKINKLDLSTYSTLSKISLLDMEELKTFIPPQNNNNINYLFLSKVNNINALNISNLIHLKTLHLSGNNFSKIDLPKLAEIESIKIFSLSDDLKFDLNQIDKINEISIACKKNTILEHKSLKEIIIWAYSESLNVVNLHKLEILNLYIKGESKEKIFTLTMNNNLEKLNISISNSSQAEDKYEFILNGNYSTIPEIKKFSNHFLIFKYNSSNPLFNEKLKFIDSNFDMLLNYFNFLPNGAKKFINQKDLFFETNCPICLINFISFDNIIATDCKHVFHKTCFSKALRRSNNCPKCRNAIAEYNELIYLDEENNVNKKKKENKENIYLKLVKNYKNNNN